MNLFLGFVADNNDPLKVGRCKVRIVGLYDSLTMAELPWLQAVNPLNSAVIFPPAIGAQIICMALDAHNQTILMLGQIPGINDSTNSPDNHSRSAARYPSSSSMVTPSGHCIEFDDTPLGERLYIIHKSGSHIMMEPDGTVNISGNDVNITANSSITLDCSDIDAPNNFGVSSAYTGSFTNHTGSVMSIVEGIIINVLP